MNMKAWIVITRMWNTDQTSPRAICTRVHHQPPTEVRPSSPRDSVSTASNRKIISPAYRLPYRRSDSDTRSEEHTSELQSQSNLVCRLLLEKKKRSAHAL